MKILFIGGRAAIFRCSARSISLLQAADPSAPGDPPPGADGGGGSLRRIFTPWGRRSYAEIGKRRSHPAPRLPHTRGRGENSLNTSEHTLDRLPVGSDATVLSLSLSGGKRRRMLDLGFVPGSAVRALQESPWGDPVAYAVGGAVIALRREDARQIAIRNG